MQTMREAWTDERLDDLNAKVDTGFARMDTRFDEVDARFERMETRFDAMNRTLMQVGGVIVAALIGVIATQL
jgi:hypothetical protein